MNLLHIVLGLVAIEIFPEACFNCSPNRCEIKKVKLIKRTLCHMYILDGYLDLYATFDKR